VDQLDRSTKNYEASGVCEKLGNDLDERDHGAILKEHGIEPAPERDKHTSWSTFLKAHWECLAATDFFTVEVWTLTGLVTHYLLFFIDIATRSVAHRRHHHEPGHILDDAGGT